MESPEEASAMACPIVLQAVWDDMQLSLLFPLTPFTYHLVLATTVGARNRAISRGVIVRSLCVMFIFSARRVGEPRVTPCDATSIAITNAGTF